MNAQQKTLAQKCLDAAEGNTMTFPQIVAALMEGGFEGYTVDLRRSVAIYYLLTGDSVELPMHEADGEVSEAFDAAALQSAIREAQQLVAGYTYKGFCIKAKAAGCAGYMVSFPGRRALYFGRTAETHLEVFPSAA
ncbi:MAG TPA: DUF1398 domain-containing protein [Parvibaculum sp.]|jgi:uncharacterized protein YbcV (DUF1398 family)